MYVLTRSFHTVPVVILFSAHPFSTGTSTDHLHLYGMAILPHRISRIVRLRSTTMCGPFSGAKHLKCSDVFLRSDLDGKCYACLDLPSARTAKPSEIQSIYLTAQGDTCPLEALANLAQVVPARPDNPLFSWRDKHGKNRPMVKTKALLRINTILNAWGWGTTFRHSFRIGGASFFFAQGVNPKIVCLAGQWKSLVYEAYI